MKPQPRIASLTLGNFAIGSGTMVVPGMLIELSADLRVTPAAVGLLISAFAAAVCVGGPFLASWTSRIERRRLLTGTLALYAVMHLAAALSPNYAALMAVRIVTAIGAALFTAQAAATINLMVPQEVRGKAMGTVMLGWSISAVVGTPLGAYLSSHIGWRPTIGLVALLSTVAGIWVWRQIPGGLFVTPIDGAAWRRLFSNRPLLIVLSVTAMQAVGLFILLAYLALALKESIGATPSTISLIFLCYGAAGVTGNILCVRFMDRVGPVRIGLTALGCMLAALLAWPLGHGSLPATIALATLWGLGSFALNSTQQVRLVMMAPTLASASVSLNSSSIYLGQALGAFVGGLIVTAHGTAGLSYVAAAPLALSIGLSLLAASLTQRRALEAACRS